LQRVHAPLYLDCCAARASGRVFECLRSAEKSHQAVSREVLQHSPVTVNDRGLFSCEALDLGEDNLLV
jgi:hypothetical protein